MKTIILSDNIKDIKKAALIIKHGGLVAFPTETVYGLGALGLCEASIKKIYSAKGRPANNPMIMHVDCADSAFKLWDIIDRKTKDKIDKLIKQFWPGPLTIIARKAEIVPNIVCANLSKIAIRMPDNDISIKLIREVGEPLVAPSANISTRPSPTSAAHVISTLSGRIDAVIEGGTCHHGLESTVVDLSNNKPTILRLGATSISDIVKILPDCIVSHKKAGPTASPGLLSKHYSPDIKRIIAIEAKELKSLWSLDTAIIALHSSAKGLARRTAATILMDDDPRKFAKNIYGALYKMEQLQVTSLAIERPSLQQISQNDLWQAIDDRIKRACQH